MTNLPGSCWTVVIVLRTKVFAKTFLEHYSQTMFTKIVRMLRTGLKGNNRLPVLTLHSKLSEELKRLAIYRVFDLRLNSQLFEYCRKRDT